MFGNILIIGGSSGIGLAIAELCAPIVKELVCVSRRKSPFGTWLKADITNQADISQIAQHYNNRQLDALLYLGGTWEKNAFTSEYDFKKSTATEVQQVIDVNLRAPITLIQALLASLERSENPRVIIIGAAISGLNLTPSREVANTASKFGLRGAVFALRQSLQASPVGITLINPGNIATPEVLSDLQAMDKGPESAIPVKDLFETIKLILNLSTRTNINEIDMPNM